MTSYCFVLDVNDRALSPTKEKKGWYLIRKNRAKLVNKFPMVIQLLKEIPPEKIDKTPIVLGIDDGAKYTGIALVQDYASKNKPVFKGTIEHRQDVKDKIDVRRGHRKYRRSHKKYRKKRFDNRCASKRKGRIPPSIKQKKEAILRVIKKLTQWCEWITFI
ncbi:RRXRR domain-containing protein [Niallia sp. 01092]|uniref:RRXRR domain-containing protein n=1 Tax=unclassified Niallia TaxID=2837522 RepID=UPI003FD6740F